MKFSDPLTVSEFVPRARIIETDMHPDLQNFAIATATSVEANGDVGENAAYIATKFDDKFGGKWQCVVGTMFGLHFTHIKHTFMFLYIGEWAVLIYKSSHVV